MFGLSQVDRLLDMEIKNGTLRVKVAGQVVLAPKLPVDPAGIGKLFQAALKGKAGGIDAGSRRR